MVSMLFCSSWVVLVEYLQPCSTATSWMLELLGNCFDDLEEEAKQEQCRDIMDSYLQVTEESFISWMVMLIVASKQLRFNRRWCSTRRHISVLSLNRSSVRLYRSRLVKQRWWLLSKISWEPSWERHMKVVNQVCYANVCSEMYADQNRALTCRQARSFLEGSGHRACLCVMKCVEV